MLRSVTVLRRFDSQWDKLGRKNALGAILTRNQVVSVDDLQCESPVE
jgi:hypothetical protein